MMNILIVDDEAPIKRSLMKIIEKELQQLRVVSMADNGLEALGKIEELLPDLVISDVRMPVMDGMQLSRAIRARGYQTEIVMVSGYNEYAYLREALQQGVTDYLLKPVDPHEVALTLRRVYQKHENKLKERVEMQTWLADRKSSIRKLAESVWFLHENHVWEHVDALEDSLGREPDAARSSEYAMQWLTLVNAEFKQLSDGKLGMEQYPEFQEMAKSANFGQHIRKLLNESMEDIRKIRNWGSHRSIRNALDYIQDHYGNETLSLGEISDAVGMSATYFSKCFRQEMGISCIQYITRLRMEKAVELLANPSFKVYEVAHAIGFSEYAHFAKVFKKTFDFSPSEYRSNLGIT
jgi:two-component system response regulator YesN